MISEGPRDTEDWSTDAENPVMRHRNTFHLTIYSNSSFKNNISLLFLLYFDQIN